MKILIANNLYHPYRVGGAEISVQTLAENLQKRGIKVAVLTLGEYEVKDVVNGVQVWRLKLKNDYWPYKSLNKHKFQKLVWHYKDRLNQGYNSKILEILDDFCPDIVHTNNLLGFSVALWELAEKRNINIVHTLRDYYLQCPKTTKFRKNSTCPQQCFECHFMSIPKKRLSQKVNAVVGISSFILNAHLRAGYFNKARKKVIYNGFNTTRNYNKSPYIFNKNSYIHFGYIGQISEAKGVKELIKNLKKIDKFQNWDLTIAGNVDEFTKREFLNILPPNKIHFMGYVDPDDFYNKINVLVVPSIWDEPFGRVVVEALNKNVIVLGSRVGGISEILKNLLDFTFNPVNEDLYLLLKRVIHNPEVLNSYDIENSEMDRFSLERLVSQYQDLYKELLN